jgi:hypothetical protein
VNVEPAGESGRGLTRECVELTGRWSEYNMMFKLNIYESSVGGTHDSQDAR